MHISSPFLEKLADEFRARRRRNPAYSLRSFGRDLNVSPGRLSQYFSKTRTVTPKAAHQMMNRLGLSPLEQASWMGLSILHPAVTNPSVLVTATRSGKAREGSTIEPHLLDQKVFELISEPIHFTILSLLETEDFKNNTKWIASRIRSSVPEVSASLQLLQELGLIQKSSDGNLALTHHEGTKSSDGVKNAALQRAHQRQLQDAIESLESVALELRDITSMTFATDAEKLPEAKALIKDFRRKLSHLLQSGKKSEVYRLQIQLLPLTEVRPPRPTGKKFSGDRS
ncbi:MAG: DUF4423 domain-containing protein [Bdellovibrionia bacterium]